ncbi:metal ABC transporter substrate-binding protein [Gemmatimonadota bacterium]
MAPSHSALALSLVLALTTGCQVEENPQEDSGRPVVVASIFPLGDLARQMAGDLVRVEVLLPAGADLHTFDVTPRQLRDFVDAGLFLMIGGGLDEWMARIPAASGGTGEIVRLSDGIPLMAGDDHDATGNPHIWLDPVLVRDQLLPRIEAALKALAPEGAEVIGLRAHALSDSLTALDAEIRMALDPLENRSFVATHPAWSYFAARYGLDEAGVIHAHPGEEPSSRELAELLETAETRLIDCVFTEPQMGEVAARAIATELSLPTCLLDPLGGPDVEGRDGYFQLLRFNTRQFVQGLQKGGR